jgi:4-hydroxy-3-polyprenylbenzoate decarboxylase
MEASGIDPFKLPVLTSLLQVGEPFITLPCVVTRNPYSGERNVGMYRVLSFPRLQR